VLVTLSDCSVYINNDEAASVMADPVQQSFTVRVVSFAAVIRVVILILAARETTVQDCPK